MWLKKQLITQLFKQKILKKQLKNNRKMVKKAENNILFMIKLNIFNKFLKNTKNNAILFKKFVILIIFFA